jgi:Fur family ferric uptake transcriptional regulator
MTEVEERFELKLTHARYSLTRPRRLLFEVMQKHQALSMSELTKLCVPTIDRSSLYRAVALFEKLGIVQRIHIGWKHRLELSDDFSPHHHHAICERCGKVLDTREHAELEYELAVLARHYGFTPTIHQLEIRGICGNCSAQAAGKLQIG